MIEEKTSNKKTYITFMVIIGVVITIFLGYQGYHWHQKSYFKNLLQKEFDRQYQSWGRGSFCYRVGKVKLPYIDRGYSSEYIQQYKLLQEDSSQIYKFPSYWQDDNKYQLNRVLPIFYQAGLLSRQKIEGTEYYQYDITEEGKKYQSEYDNRLVFCYGYQKVLEVTDIQKRDSFTYKGKTDVIVTYNYELKDFPDWLMHEDFIEVYSRVKGPNRIGRETFIESKGNIFIDGDFNSHIYGPRYRIE